MLPHKVLCTSRVENGGGVPGPRPGLTGCPWRDVKAMLRDGYHGTMSLETHWNGAGNMEDSSRQSMAGTKELLRKAGALK